MSAASLRILVCSFDYRPRRGGVATCSFELSAALAASDAVSVRMLTREVEGGPAFDRHGRFETVRVPLPAEAALAAPLLATRLAAQVLAWRPHAVLADLWMPSGLAARMCFPVLAALRVPYFVMAHGVEVMESSRTFKKRARRTLRPVKQSVFRGAAAVFSVSHFTGLLLRQTCGLRPEGIQVTYNGVDPGEFFPAPKAADLVRSHGLDGKKVLVTVSRLNDYKGVDRAIAALRFVKEAHPDVRYLICGEGPDRARLEALARHYRVHGQVVFVGDVPPERLRDYYNLADAFVLLTREDFEAPNFEGFGIVFLEAAACAKPSIAGLSGGISDAVVDGLTGWLVDPTDDRAIARGILECLGSPAEARRRGEHARLRATGSMTWSAMAERVLTEVRRHVRN